MHDTGTFELHVRPGDTAAPARVRIALQRHTEGEDGRHFVTPECATLDEIEGKINALQDELDELRMRARRIFRGVA
jgi:hypothetical protein